MVAGIHKGLIIEPIYERGQWRILVKKADGSSLRMAFPGGVGSEVAQHWLSSPYTDKEFGIVQVKDAIDRGQIT